MSEFPSFPLGKICPLPQGLKLWVEKAKGEGEVETFSALTPPPAPSLSPREEAFWKTLIHPRRRREWKQGRLMAKLLLAETLGALPNAFELLQQEEGPPLVFFHGHPLQSGRLSISHTSAYVGVAFAPFAVGLDICDRADITRIQRIAHRAFSADEAALCQNPQHLTALWALKEAALKMQSGGIFNPGLSAVRLSSLCPPALSSPQAEACLYALPLAHVALAWQTAPL